MLHKLNTMQPLSSENCNMTTAIMSSHKEVLRTNGEDNSFTEGKRKWGSEMLVPQSCLTLCEPMDCSPPGSSVRGIIQARILEWIVISFSRGSSLTRNWTLVSWIAGNSSPSEHRAIVTRVYGFTLAELWQFLTGWALGRKENLSSCCWALLLSQDVWAPSSGFPIRFNWGFCLFIFTKYIYM